MDVATRATESLLPKLGELLMEEYMLHARVKKDVQRLRTELTVMYAPPEVCGLHETSSAGQALCRPHRGPLGVMLLFHGHRGGTLDFLARSGSQGRRR
ncbi:hypothetical protein ZWY2020_025085 [Hordeum vulgare]|nr:hypothetical protein ZWY2020_025085 [Hordeum vulgare]